MLVEVEVEVQIGGGGGHSARRAGHGDEDASGVALPDADGAWCVAVVRARGIPPKGTALRGHVAH